MPEVLPLGLVLIIYCVKNYHKQLKITHIDHPTASVGQEPRHCLPASSISESSKVVIKVLASAVVSAEV